MAVPVSRVGRQTSTSASGTIEVDGTSGEFTKFTDPCVHDGTTGRSSASPLTISWSGPTLLIVGWRLCADSSRGLLEMKY
jgi:hypothetical protein